MQIFDTIVYLIVDKKCLLLHMMTWRQINFVLISFNSVFIKMTSVKIFLKHKKIV